MLANSSLIFCNLSIFPSSLPLKIPNFRPQHSPRIQNPKLTITSFLKLCNHIISISHSQKKNILQICRNSLDRKKSEDSLLKGVTSEKELGGNGGGGEGRDWTTSALLFVLWIALMYYVFNLAPNQTPSRDMYFLKKLLNLKGDDGFKMNEVLVSLWYIMGLWPLVYSMLLLPTDNKPLDPCEPPNSLSHARSSGRDSKSSIPVWPFLILSCFGGAYALLPYFVLWTPPPPPVEESELRRWPLNFTESKITAGISIVAGLGMIIFAGLANGDVWKEFYQYFRESKFIHITCLDFTLLSAFAPFWVYNDMTARKWYDKGFWLLPSSLVPFLGPALYLVLRPSVSTTPVSLTPLAPDQE